MNAKAETIGTNKTADTGLVVLGILALIAGVAAYYLLPTSVKPIWHTLSVVAGIVVACAIIWFSGPGHAVRDYVHETQIEMRKVVWPTREETTRTTIVVIVVTILIAVVLGLIDIFLKWAILDHLLKW